MAHESTLEFRDWKFNQQLGFIEVVLHRHDVIFNTYLPINTKNIRNFTHKMKHFLFFNLFLLPEHRH